MRVEHQPVAAVEHRCAAVGVFAEQRSRLSKLAHRGRARPPARYHLALATHSEVDLKCWAPDLEAGPLQRSGASAKTAGALSPFDGTSVVDRLNVASRAYAGTEQRCSDRTVSTQQQGGTADCRAALGGIAGVV
jgi:hypothetical protein